MKWRESESKERTFYPHYLGRSILPTLLSTSTVGGYGPCVLRVECTQWTGRRKGKVQSTVGEDGLRPLVCDSTGTPSPLEFTVRPFSVSPLIHRLCNEILLHSTPYFIPHYTTQDGLGPGMTVCREVYGAGGGI